MKSGLRSYWPVFGFVLGHVHFVCIDIIFILGIRTVITLDKSVFTRLGILFSIGPAEAGFVFELLLEQFQSTVQSPITKLCALAAFTNSAPPGPGLEIISIRTALKN